MNKVRFTATLSREKYDILHNYLKENHLRNNQWLDQIIDENIGLKKSTMVYEYKMPLKLPEVTNLNQPRPLNHVELDDLRKLIKNF